MATSRNRNHSAVITGLRHSGEFRLIDLIVSLLLLGEKFANLSKQGSEFDREIQTLHNEGLAVKKAPHRMHAANRFQPLVTLSRPNDLRFGRIFTSWPPLTARTSFATP